MIQKIILSFTLCWILTTALGNDSTRYLFPVIAALKKQWPDNRVINLVFHGHSVPAGYFKTPVVNSLGAYPQQVLKKIKTAFPFAVVNVIVTAIGGENAVSGAKRFETEVLVHQPDVLFIDYALNDRGPGLEKAKQAWEEMIQKTLAKNIKVILLTPSPDQSVDIATPGNILDQHRNQIRSLARAYKVGLVDSYGLFEKIARQNGEVKEYMSQINHPNEKGHALIAEEIFRYFVE